VVVVVGGGAAHKAVGRAATPGQLHGRWRAQPACPPRIRPTAMSSSWCRAARRVPVPRGPRRVGGCGRRAAAYLKAT